MRRKPRPLLRPDIYNAAHKAKWIGEVEADDEREAIERGAKKFKTDTQANRGEATLSSKPPNDCAKDSCSVCC